MRWFLDLPIRAKLLIGFGLMVVFLAVVTISAYLAMTAIQESQRSLYAHEFAIAVDLEELRSNQNATRAATLTMMMLSQRSDQEAQHQEIKNLTKENTAMEKRGLASTTCRIPASQNSLISATFRSTKSLRSSAWAGSLFAQCLK